jgi:hypothetical protein
MAYRPAERATLVDHKVRAFCLASGNLRAHDMAQLYLDGLERLTALCAEPGPFLFVVSRGGIRPVDLH